LRNGLRGAKHDGAETIALVAGIKPPKPLLSLDHCSGRSTYEIRSPRIHSNHQALRLLLFVSIGCSRRRSKLLRPEPGLLEPHRRSHRRCRRASALGPPRHQAWWP